MGAGLAASLSALFVSSSLRITSALILASVRAFSSAAFLAASVVDAISALFGAATKMPWTSARSGFLYSLLSLAL